MHLAEGYLAIQSQRFYQLIACPWPAFCCGHVITILVPHSCEAETRPARRTKDDYENNQLFFFDTPAMENGWQGNPAARMSWSGISAGLISRMSPCGLSPNQAA